MPHPLGELDIRHHTDHFMLNICSESPARIVWLFQLNVEFPFPSASGLALPEPRTMRGIAHFIHILSCQEV